MRSTESRSRRSVIGKIETKKYSKLWLKNQTIGQNSEDEVKRLFLARGFEFLAQRIKIHKSEVDLIFSKNNVVKLIEVKSLSHEWRVFDRISERQMNKLRLNRVLLANQFPEIKFESWIAFMESKNLGALSKNRSVRFIRLD